MPGRILIIDDEPQITRVLRAALSAQGYDLRTANDPEEGLEIYREWSPDLVVTDLMMPGLSGVEVTRAIRVRFSTPIIILSVRDHERSKVEALDAGADDYVTKPFSIQELLARIRAHLRRAPERTSAALETGDFVVDANAHSITVLGKPIHLTPKEFDLLLHLSRHAGKVITHRACSRRSGARSPPTSLNTSAFSSGSSARNSRPRPASSTFRPSPGSATASFRKESEARENNPSHYKRHSESAPTGVSIPLNGISTLMSYLEILVGIQSKLDRR